MAVRFAYQSADGVAIVVAAPKADLERVLGRLTEDQYRRHVVERSIPAGHKYIELKDDWTPPDDRTFRGAWTLDGKAVTVDMPKARKLFLDRVREARVRKLEALDNEWMKATGQGRAADAVYVETERQALRDLPQTLNVDAASTTEALKALWPRELT